MFKGHPKGLLAEEQYENGVHNVVTETLAHIAKSRC